MSLETATWSVAAGETGDHEDSASEIVRKMSKHLGGISETFSTGDSTTYTSVSTPREQVVHPLVEVALPKFSPLSQLERSRFSPLQEWEGVVMGVNKDTFVARLLDKTAGDSLPFEEADLPVSDLSEDDLSLLKPGAVFRWTIGYQRSSGGTKKRLSQIVFRRLPQFTSSDAVAARKEAARLASEIDWD
jgi:hypothetical protein